MVTYYVDRMRVTRPSGKTAARHPERLYTVNGVFYSTAMDPNGNLVVKDKLSIISKNIDMGDVKSPEFDIDLANNLLSMPEGKRGRMAQMGLSEDEIFADLNNLRGIVTSDDIDDIDDIVEDIPSTSTSTKRSK